MITHTGHNNNKQALQMYSSSDWCWYLSEAKYNNYTSNYPEKSNNANGKKTDVTRKNGVIVLI